MANFTRARLALAYVGLAALLAGCDRYSRDLIEERKDAAEVDAGARSDRDAAAGAGDESTDASARPANDAGVPMSRTGNAGRMAEDAAAAAGMAATEPPLGHDHMAGGQAGAPATAPAAGSPAVPLPGAAAISFNVALTSEEEVPRCDAAMGAAVGSVNVSADAKSLSVVLSYSGLTGPATLAHIHFGAIGMAGPVVLDLGPNLSSPIRRTFRAEDYAAPAGAPADFAALIQALRAGKTYFNLHTAACGSGELRGQLDDIEPEEAVTGLGERFDANLTAAQAVPVCARATQAAVGMGTVMVAPDRKSFVARVTHAGLSGAPLAGHIHFGAAGATGPVLLTLDLVPNTTQTFRAGDYVAPAGGPADFAALIAAFRAGQTYFNLHTDACAIGEIRGQIAAQRALTDAPSEFQTRLLPGEAVPACLDAAPNGIGIGTLVISPDEKQLEISLAHNWLSGPPTMAHIHFGGAGTTGPVILNLGSKLTSPIQVVIDQADYVAPMGGPRDFAGVIAAIRNGQTYFNVHTSACAHGEMRGQITP